MTKVSVTASREKAEKEGLLGKGDYLKLQEGPNRIRLMSECMEHPGEYLGNPVVIAGVEFPILASAQRSRNVPVTANAIDRNKNEEFPPSRVTGRWQNKRKVPRRARQLAKAARAAHARAS